MSSEFAQILKAQMLMNLSRQGVTQNALLNFVAVQAIEQGFAKFPVLINLLTNYYKQRAAPLLLTSAAQNVESDVDRPPAGPVRSQLFVEKFYHKGKDATPTTTNKINRVVESIVHLLTTVPRLKSLLYNGTQLLPNDKTPIILDHDNDVWFALSTVDRDAEGLLEKISFMLFSYKNDIITLKRFLNDCETNYNRAVQNELGDALYFFDQHIINVPARQAGSARPMGPGGYRMPSLPFLLYSKHHFTSNRTFENVFFEDKDLLVHRLNFFQNNKEWYAKRGVPRTLGFLFSGPPGCGKTSTIKAIANHTGRSIFNISLKHVTTKKQLKHLFYSEDVNCNVGGGSEIRGDNTVCYKIPVSRRLYVLEDIDATNSVASRESPPKGTPIDSFDDPPYVTGGGGGNSQAQIPSGFGGFSTGIGQQSQRGAQLDIERVEDDEQEIDLATILNILDGTMETPERIIIMTSNYPEKLDTALIRPGRIDLFINFKMCSRQILAQMFESYYERTIPEEILEKFPDYIWSPAEITQLLFRYFGDPEGFLKTVITGNPKEVFKYRQTQLNSSQTIAEQTDQFY